MKPGRPINAFAATVHSGVIALGAIAIAATALGAHTAYAEEKQVPRYTPAPQIGGALTSVGSDSMADLMALWADGYKKLQPQVALNVTSRGSATAPAALIEGAADLGPMSRPMKTAEISEFKTKYGFEPTQVRTAIAAVTVYVAKENPIEEISFEQLDAIFSTSRKRGAVMAAATWGDLGVKGEFATQPIMAVGVTADLTTQAFFRQQVMLQGEFVPNLMATANNEAMFQMIASNRAAIGFGEARAQNGRKAVEGVKAIAVRRAKEDKAIAPSEANLLSGDYPLGRYLNIYVVRYPGEAVEPSTRDFLRYVLSEQGQRVVRSEGLIPLTPKMVREELAKLE